MLHIDDAIYVTSWGAYNGGWHAGGWFKLADLAGLDKEEIFDVFEEIGLQPRGRDEELVIHDYDDYSGLGYYNMFGETYPLRVIEFYEEVIGLDDQELLAFIGIADQHGIKYAMEHLENGTLDDTFVVSEAGFDEMVDEDISMFSKDRCLQYIDTDKLHDYFSEGYYDEDDEDAEFDASDADVVNMAEEYGEDFLRGFVDREQVARDYMYDYGEFDFNGETYFMRMD